MLMDATTSPIRQASWLLPVVSREVMRELLGLAMLATAAGPAGAQTTTAAPARAPAFRSGIELVSVAAVVRDKRGRVVGGLSRDDFIVLEGGTPRRIVEFSPAEEGPISVALLFDVSGSMAMAPGRSAIRAVDHLLRWLNPALDEVGLYAFDSRLEEVQPFTTDAQRVRAAIDRLGAFGSTSLYDAIGDVARRLAERSPRRRAVLVVTDGLDNGSRLTPAEVSGLASRTDVPVYVVAVLSRFDRPSGRPSDRGGRVGEAIDALAALAWGSGGEVFAVSSEADASLAARSLLTALRHQYVLAFESGEGAGWRPLDIRLRRRELTVRARSGYMSSPPGRPTG
jgi:Ca-activated chloride channel family protein